MVSRPRSLTMGLGLVSLAACLAATIPAFSEEQNCPETDTGVSLPSGFCATIFADKVGHARQLAVAPDGTVYVNTWSGIYYGNDKPHDGGFLIALKDTKGTGHADVNVRFGPTFAEGAHGGTGIWLYKNSLYVELDDTIVRYLLKDSEAAPTGKAETILSGMPVTGDHPMHGFAIDADGNLFVEMGTATNACEKENRMPHSPGIDPCTELETRGGIGDTTPTKAIRYSRRRNAMRPATATPRASTSTQMGASTSPSMDATSCTRTGRNCTPPNRAGNCPPRR
jgi:glucose/arabinose dehydrogenase